MNKVLTKFLAGSLSFSLVAGALMGCSPKSEQTSIEQNKPKPGVEEPLKLPITKEPIKLTYFQALNENVTATMKSNAEIKIYQKLEKRTGIQIEWRHPPVGQEQEQFKLMVASNDLPDIIATGWMGYPGGITKAMQDKLIVRLNDYIDSYAPNLKKILKEKPEIKKQLETDNGDIAFFPLLNDEKATTSYGPQIRKDWLDKLGLQVPVTVDDWYNVLKAFKEKDPNGNGQKDEIPFVVPKQDYPPTTAALANASHFIIGAYGITYGLIQKDGKVCFGPVQPEFKEYLKTMQKWYKEGLIDPDFANTDKKSFDAKITSERAGAWLGWVGSNMGPYINALKAKGSGAKIVGTTNPVLKAGDRAIVGHMSPLVQSTNHAITTKNKHLKETVQWFDYKYSQEGHILSNFGIEGEAYTMKDGKPVYTDLIMKNPQGLAPFPAAAKYTLSMCNAAYIMDYNAFIQRYPIKEQQEAIAKWSDAENKILMPYNVTPLPEETKKAASIINNINTYLDEAAMRFITGKDSLDNFDKFVNTLKQMGLDDYIKIYQSALERYNNRK